MGVYSRLATGDANICCMKDICCGRVLTTAMAYDMIRVHRGYGLDVTGQPVLYVHNYIRRIHG